MLVNHQRTTIIKTKQSVLGRCEASSTPTAEIIKNKKGYKNNGKSIRRIWESNYLNKK